MQHKHHRISVLIEDDKTWEIYQDIPFGIKTKLFYVLAWDLARIIVEKGADQVIGAILGKYIHLNEYSRVLRVLYRGQEITPVKDALASLVSTYGLSTTIEAFTALDKELPNAS